MWWTSRLAMLMLSQRGSSFPFNVGAFAVFYEAAAHQIIIKCDVSPPHLLVTPQSIFPCTVSFCVCVCLAPQQALNLLEYRSDLPPAVHCEAVPSATKSSPRDPESTTARHNPALGSAAVISRMTDVAQTGNGKRVRPPS